MTSLELQTALKNRIEEIVKNLKLKSAENKNKSIQVFEQHLPIKIKSTSRNPESTLYPCIVIMLDEGSVAGMSMQEEVKVYFVIGVYDEEDDNHGYKDAMIIKERILINLQENPLIEQLFEFIPKFKWKYDDESNVPYHFVWIEAFFEVPRIIREDIETMI